MFIENPNAKNWTRFLNEFEDFERIEILTEDETFVARKMFGGLANYYKGLLVLVFMQSTEDSNWNGLLIPTFREHHETLIKEMPELRPHAILGKWLYISRTDESYERVFKKILTLIKQESKTIGILPKTKKRKSKKNPKK